MSNDSLDTWLQRLQRLHPEEIELGLDRVGDVAGRLGLLPLPQPVVTVAGTNGKGSTVAVLESLINGLGRTAGVFTSPHLQRFNERIRVGGREASDEEICDAFATIEAERDGTSLTYFEFSTLAALLVFSRRAPDLVLLEVGLGGRLDAVNIVDPTVAIITSIALDHQQWLGDTRDAIAREKAGILRSGVPVIVADVAPPPSLAVEIERIGARPALFFGPDFGADKTEKGWSGYVWGASGGRIELPSLPIDSLLPVNVCAALQAAELLRLPWCELDVPRVLQDCRPAGRRQFIQRDGISYVMDVAHNPAAIEKLVEYLKQVDCKKRKIAIFSAMSDKDIPGMIGAAAGYFDAWFVADQADHSRALGADATAQLLQQAGEPAVTGSATLAEAFHAARQEVTGQDLLVVFGSFTTVGALSALICPDDMAREASTVEQQG